MSLLDYHDVIYFSTSGAGEAVECDPCLNTIYKIPDCEGVDCQGCPECPEWETQIKGDAGIDAYLEEFKAESKAVSDKAGAGGLQEVGIF